MAQQAALASRMEAFHGASPTLGALFWNAVRAHGGRPAQEWHNGAMWVRRTYDEFGAAVRDVANALLAAGTKKGDRVAIWSRNAPQWGEVDFANQTAGFATVPIYDTLTGDKGAYILNDSEAKVLFVQDAAILARVLPLRSTLSSLRRV
ncbi:MAG: AMP-binding protein, partial [Halobacteriales archaeon]|nr:AMP-binding protein [Halobacteriales archaeon]